MGNTKRLIIAVLMSLVIIAFGTAGYMLIEGWNALDAVYMTIITLTTVGFKEVHDISSLGQIYTILLIFAGVGFSLYVAGSIVQFVMEGQIRTILGRRRLDKRISDMKNHYIVCGYGRIGRVLCHYLKNAPVEMVIIEKNPDLIPVMEEDGVYYLHGDAGQEAVLLKAGIDRAKGLIAVLASDSDNVFLVLTARQLNPDLYIVARSSQEESKSKLRAAGANTVESPYDFGALRLAQRIIRPTVTSFFDFAFGAKREAIQMEEIPVRGSSSLANLPLKDSGIRQAYNLIIIAIKEADGNMVFNPSFETVIKSGDTVVAVGEAENLKKLEKVLNSSDSQHAGRA
jgi:voltage-gated potassium channel